MLLDHLFDPAKQHFNTVLAHLDAFGGVRYVITAARHMRLISTAFAAPTGGSRRNRAVEAFRVAASPSQSLYTD